MITLYTDKIKTAGLQAGPLILIHPDYKSDKGLHEHEKTHVTQWQAVTGISLLLFIVLYLTFSESWIMALSPLSIAIHGLTYKLNPSYRLHCEVQAYREQASHYPDDRRPIFAKYISQDYDLDITPQRALSLLYR